jgi:hypothetical protein
MFINKYLPMVNRIFYLRLIVHIELNGSISECYFVNLFIVNFSKDKK